MHLDRVLIPKRGTDFNGFSLRSRAGYSYFKELAGLAEAALSVRELTVIKAKIRTMTEAPRKGKTERPSL